MLKKVCELFEQATFIGSSINDLTVLEVKFSKKNNAAIIQVDIDRKIVPKDLYEFSKNAEVVFNLKAFKVIPIVSAKQEVNIACVEEVIDLVGLIFPYMKDIFKDSKISLLNGEVSIELKVPSASFLKLKKTDEYISDLVKKFYGGEVAVNIYDALNAKEDFAKNHKEERLIKPQVGEQPAATSQAKPKNMTSDSPKPAFIPQPKQPAGPLPEGVIYGRGIKDNVKVDKIEDINQDMDTACIEGKIEAVEVKTTKTGKEMFTVDISDSTSTISTKIFADPKRIDVGELTSKLKVGNYIKADGAPQYDMYAKDVSIILRNIVEGKKPKPRTDDAEVKRVELHMHTQMSAMDGVSSATDIVKQAIKWGHKAVAITDHGVLQSFPEANLAAFNYAEKKFDIKVLYGVEGYLIPDVEPNTQAPDTYVVFDIETTGFTPGSDAITEIAAVKVKNGEFIDEFSTFVNPERNIPKDVQELTHITPEMVKDAPKIEEALKGFLDFAKDCTIVAHNARFDTSFINYFAEKCGYEKPIHIIDTLAISREMFEGYENHKLGTIAENLGVELENAHRAINDARATAKVFVKMCEVVESKNMKVSDYVQTEFIEDKRQMSPYHIIILAKNYVGLKNLYKLVSFSHIRYFHKKPRLSMSLILRYREGLIIGSACERGELFQAIMEGDVEKSKQIAKYYDYLEIQPIGNNEFYVRNGTVANHEELRNLNRKIVDLGHELDIPVFATCDVH